MPPIVLPAAVAHGFSGGDCVGRQCKPAEPDGRTPTRLPTDREVGDSGVNRATADRMPWFPTHATVCEGRPCRPGEGNLKHVREKGAGGGWRYKQWTQPYIHREAWVQHRGRAVPHAPDPQTTYAALAQAARRVAADNLVIVTAGDWDYRELVLNWVAHAHKWRYHNALVLAMDRELSDELQRRRIPFADLSAQLQRWNETCMQRHIQAVRTERHVAVAAVSSRGTSMPIELPPPPIYLQSYAHSHSLAPLAHSSGARPLSPAAAARGAGRASHRRDGRLRARLCAELDGTAARGLRRAGAAR